MDRDAERLWRRIAAGDRSPETATAYARALGAAEPGPDVVWIAEMDHGGTWIVGVATTELGAKLTVVRRWRAMVEDGTPERFVDSSLADDETIEELNSAYGLWARKARTGYAYLDSEDETDRERRLRDAERRVRRARREDEARKERQDREARAARRRWRPRPGDRVRVSPVYGAEGGREGIVIHPSDVPIGDRGVPRIAGHYKPADWSRETPVMFDDGRLLVAPTGLLEIITPGVEDA